jgi:hypothetical protein
MKTVIIAAAAAMLMATSAQAKWTEDGCYELYPAKTSKHGVEYRARPCKFDVGKFFEQFSPDGHGVPGARDRDGVRGGPKD